MATKSKSKNAPSRSPAHLLYFLKDSVRTIKEIATQLESKKLTPGLMHRRHLIWQEAIDVLYEPPKEEDPEQLTPVEVEKADQAKAEAPNQSIKEDISHAVIETNGRPRGKGGAKGR